MFAICSYATARRMSPYFVGPEFSGISLCADMWRATYPFSGAIIVFRAKRADRVKILVWDGSGLVLVWKRLEEGAFKWPPIMDGVMRLSPARSFSC